jgi:intron-binding protein aquarius
LIQETFEELEKCRVFELLKNNKQRADYLVNNYVKLVAMTSTHAILKSDYFLDSAFRATTVIFEESGQLLDFETFAPLTFSKGLRRMILIGDDN